MVSHRQNHTSGNCHQSYMAKDALLERDCYVKVLHDVSDETLAEIKNAIDKNPLGEVIYE